jgi:hypothetical protein
MNDKYLVHAFVENELSFIGCAEIIFSESDGINPTQIHLSFLTEATGALSALRDAYQISIRKTL